MSIFGTHLADHQSDLERALLGIVPSDDFVYKFQNAPASQIYIIPVKSVGDNVHGFFWLENKLHNVALGFEQFQEEGKPNPYLYKRDGIQEGTILTNRLYLPLQESPFFVADADGAYASYGLRGVEINTPVMFLYEVQHGMCLLGLRKGAAGGITPYWRVFEGDEQIPFRRYWSDFFLGNHNETSSLEETLDEERAEPRSERTTDPGIGAVDPIDWDWWEEPKNIVQYLDDEGVIGQYRAKKALAVVFSDLMAQIHKGIDPIKKKNLLLVGDSGTGKSMMLALLAKKAQIPVVRFTASGKTVDGYVGGKPKDALEELRDITSGEAPYGIYVVHEIDKTTRDYGLSSGGWGPKLQDTFIGWSEAELVTLDSKIDGRPRTIHTRNITFLYDGAFLSGNNGSLQAIAGERDGRKRVGFATEDDVVQQKKKTGLTVNDLIEYGMKEEWSGRIAVIAALHPHSVDSLITILKNKKSSPLEGFADTFEAKGYSLEIKSEVLRVIAEACSEKTGARALDQICNHLFFEIVYDPKEYAADDSTITITEDLARRLLEDYQGEQ